MKGIRAGQGQLARVAPVSKTKGFSEFDLMSIGIAKQGVSTVELSLGEKDHMRAHSWDNR